MQCSQIDGKLLSAVGIMLVSLVLVQSPKKAYGQIGGLDELVERTTELGAQGASEPQIDALRSLQMKIGSNLSVTWSADHGSPFVISNVEFEDSSGDLEKLLERFWDDNNEQLDAIFGITEEDSFERSATSLGYGGGEGYRIRYQRWYQGIRVQNEFIEFRIVKGNKLSVNEAPETHDVEKSQAVTLVEVVARMHRHLATDSRYLTAGAMSRMTASLAASTLDMPNFLEETGEPLFIYINGKLYYVWRFFSEDSNEEIGSATIDANTGDVVSLYPSRMYKAGRIRIPVTREHELYDPAIGKHSYRPFPDVPIFGFASPQTPCRGFWHLGKTDYHGNFSIDIPSTPWSPVTPCPSRPGTTCSSGDCVYLDFLLNGNGENIQEEWSDPIVDSMHLFLNMTHQMGGVLSSPEGSDYSLPFLPQLLHPADDCNGNQMNSTSYHAKAYGVDWMGRRAEVAYHFNRAKHIWSDYGSALFANTHLKVGIQIPNVGATYTGLLPERPVAYSRWLSNGEAEVGIPLGYCAGDTTQSDNDEERYLRHEIAHEATHVVEISTHDGFLVHDFFGDLPNCSVVGDNNSIRPTSCFSEGLAMSLPGFLQYFEDQREVSSNLSYPSNYYCAQREDLAGMSTACNPYMRGQMLAMPFSDFLISAGPGAFKAIARSLADISYESRFIDPSCSGSWEYENCWQDSVVQTLAIESGSAVYYPTSRLEAEASRAWHKFITDGNPGFLGCPYRCGAAITTDPLPDIFPWWDDITNVPFAAPFVQTDYPVEGYEHTLAGTTYGVIEYLPESCGLYRTPGTDDEQSYQCRPLALENVDDVDFYSVYLHAGETYWVWTDVTTSGELSDTVLAVSDKLGVPIVAWTNDDCSNSAIPHTNESSCLVLSPTTSAVYRIGVWSYPSQSLVGSDHHYKLHVRQVGDDFGDTRQNATAAAFQYDQDGYVNSTSDQDWFYGTLTAPGYGLSYEVCAAEGLSSVSATVYNSNMVVVDSPAPGPCVSGELVGLGVGQYYIRIGGNGSETGRYVLKKFLPAQIFESTNQNGENVVSLSSLPSPYPSGFKAFAGSSGGLFKMYLNRNTYFNVDALVYHCSSLLCDLSVEIMPDYRDSTPPQNMVVFSNRRILFDEHGAISEKPLSEIDSRGWEQGARTSMVVPWSGWYFIKVNTGGKYVLYVNNYGSVGDNMFVEP